MLVKIDVSPCETGAIIPIMEYGYPDFPGSLLHKWRRREGDFDPVVGARLYPADEPESAAFEIVGHDWAPPLPGLPAPRVVLARALAPQAASQKTWRVRKDGFSLAVITLSDKGYAGLREDKSGPLIAEKVSEAVSVCLKTNYLLPDDYRLLRALLARLALDERYDLIVTSGGTGLSPRDVTPQATASLLEQTLPGFMVAMTQASLRATPTGAISRAVAGIIGSCVVINLPGSVKAATENLAPLLPALEHAIKKLHGDKSDCGGDHVA